MSTKPQEIFKTHDKAKTEDGFRNFVAKLGVAPQGQPGNNLLSDGHYQFNLVTRNRVSLEAAYRGSWIVGKVIDCKAEDMTRAGIEITTNEGAEEISEINTAINRLQIWQSLCNNLKWGDLYGGACAVMQIKGQDLAAPIDLDSVDEGDFLGLVVYDRWQFYPALDKLINSGPDMGLPAFYDIVLGSNLNDPGMEPGGQETDNPNQRVRVHHSRCIRHIGIQLPFWQALTEMMWGESILERLWDRLIMFDDATTSAGNLISRAQLRTVGIEGLREILSAGGVQQENLIKQFELMRELQNNEGITLLDKSDEFQSIAYTFAGLSDVLVNFGQQVSGAADIPLVRLFSQSPAGMNATGDSDIRLYYDGIKARQEAKLRNPFEILLKVLWRSVAGKEAPKDLTFEFVPLWQMSATDKAAVAKTNADTVIETQQAGIISTATALKELKQSSGDSGLFTHITDEDIEEAENEEPPEPQVASAGPEVSEGAGIPGEGPTAPKEVKEPTDKVKQTMAKDSAWIKIKKWLVKDKGVEATLKEFEKGKLKSSSGSQVTSKKQALAIGYSEEGKDAKVSDAQIIKDWLNKQK